MDEERTPVDGWEPGIGLPPASTNQGGNHGGDVATIRARDITGVRRRVAGFTYQQIADELGYSDKSSARDAVLRALDRTERHDVATLRALEDERLDLVTRTMMTIMLDPNAQPKARISAASQIVRTSARRARMNGLDAPTRIAVDTRAVQDFEAVMEELLNTVAGEVTASHIEGHDDR
jgi:hypothetical protein